MTRSLAVCALCAFLLLSDSRWVLCQQPATQPSPQVVVNLDQHSDKMKRNILKLGVGHQVTAVLKDGLEYHGAITEIGDESFKLAEIDLKQVFTVRYDNVKKLYRDYGEKEPIFGRNPKRQAIILVSIMTFLTVALVAGIKHPD
ncbi:MAG TPA: hypothetical protein VGQ41_00975 [Pyrinomonadaceae bacterium]|nr:hypothetical protein [Pyrinomonadaceae bacterium]